MPVNPDPLVRPPFDEARLEAGDPRFRVEVVDTAPSTNAIVSERARAGAPAGLVVIAEHQTAGRGRLDRAWETPPRAGLTFSVLMRPRVAPTDWPWLPLLTGLALNDALRSEGFAVALKWPNDVLIAERKIAGILVERVETPDGPAAVVGIGVNVSTTPEELPVQTATSLAIESGTVPDRTTILIVMLNTLFDAYDLWQAEGPAGTTGTTRLRESYVAACATVGRDVRVDLPAGGVLLGRATGIDDGGRLIVRGTDGDVAVGAGDVVHVRALDQ